MPGGAPCRLDDRIGPMADTDLQTRCQRCGAHMDLTDPGPGKAWTPDQLWICLECGRHFWTTYPPSESGLCRPPTQWKEGTLPSRRYLKALCLRVPQVLVWSAAIPDERAVGQA